MVVIRYYYWLHCWLHFTGVPVSLVHLGHYPGNNNNITISFLIFHAKPRILLNKDYFPLATSQTFRAACRHSSKQSIESDEQCSRYITVNRTTLHRRYEYSTCAVLPGFTVHFQSEDRAHVNGYVTSLSLSVLGGYRYLLYFFLKKKIEWERCPEQQLIRYLHSTCLVVMLVNADYVDLTLDNVKLTTYMLWFLSSLSMKCHTVFRVWSTVSTTHYLALYLLYTKISTNLS